MAAERVVSTQITDEERSIETVLRPQTLEEYVGQERMKESLRICIEAAKQRNKRSITRSFMAPLGWGRPPLPTSLLVRWGLRSARRPVSCWPMRAIWPPS